MRPPRHSMSAANWGLLPKSLDGVQHYEHILPAFPDGAARRTLRVPSILLINSPNFSPPDAGCPLRQASLPC
ncbi:hypothetical protein CHELA40_15298 [Chelatococcus asaccharovorans]|nr:hypothetical protein CHELA17_60321 [Chelatococcus asaccharovorans]CAH1682096.1 hypothetical protein CHELA40_15298 [Chelatococcus asaccharovorans]